MADNTANRNVVTNEGIVITGVSCFNKNVNIPNRETGDIEVVNLISDIELTLKSEIDGYYKGDNGEFVKGKVKSITLQPRELIAQVRDVCDMFAAYLSIKDKDKHFTAELYGAMFIGATITIESTEYKATEVIPNRVDKEGNPYAAQRDCMIHSIVAATLSDRANAKIEKKLDEIDF